MLLPRRLKSAHPSIPVAIEAGIALFLPFLVVTQTATRRLFVSFMSAGFNAVGNIGTLSSIDPPSQRLFARAVLLLFLFSLPALLVLIRGPLHRLCWLPLLTLYFLMPAAMGVFAVSTPGLWIVVVSAFIIAIVGTGFGRKRKLLVLLPLLMAAEPVVGHTHQGAVYWTRNRVIERCEQAPGTRPVGWQDVAGLGYFSTTPLSPTQLLVAGEGRTRWVHRGDDGVWTVDPVKRRTGNFWQGCMQNDAVWVTNLNGLFAFTPDALDPVNIKVPHSDGERIELDLLDVVCAPDGSHWIGEFVNGGVIHRHTDGTFSRHPVGTFYAQMSPTPNGQIAIIDTTTLRTLDPATGMLGPATPAAAGGLGVDTCQTDGAVMVADGFGRLREFVPIGDGYRFSRGVNAPTPRRVAYSPDCQWIATTSGNDRTVTILRRSDLTPIKTLSMGPSLRDIGFLDDQTLAVTDACSLNLIDLP